jgi:hypothetical protein
MSDRTFRLILDGKKGGLVKGSSPSSAAKKACKKLSAEQMKNSTVFHQLSLKDKVLKTEPGKTSFKFELQETTKDSKKKVYGPYKGFLVKDKLKVKMVGGRQINNSPINNSSIYTAQEQRTNAELRNMYRTFMIRNYGEDITNRVFQRLNTQYPNLLFTDDEDIRIILKRLVDNIIQDLLRTFMNRKYGEYITSRAFQLLNTKYPNLLFTDYEDIRIILEELAINIIQERAFRAARDQEAARFRNGSPNQSRRYAISSSAKASNNIHMKRLANDERKLNDSRRHRLISATRGSQNEIVFDPTKLPNLSYRPPSNSRSIVFGTQSSNIGINKENAEQTVSQKKNNMALTIPPKSIINARYLQKHTERKLNKQKTQERKLARSQKNTRFQ